MVHNANKGIFVVSLDFELKWGGIFDNDEVQRGFEERSPVVEKIIPNILTIFDNHGIHATWATVGGIACSGKKEIEKLVSKYSDLQYKNKLSKYIKDIEDERNYFRPDLVKKIANTNGQEIATHTFSHLSMYENTNAEAILNDELTCSQYSLELISGHKINSIVFPKNQVDKNVFHILEKNAISVIRGNQQSKRFNTPNKMKKYFRYLDAYLPVCGKNSYSKSEIFHDGIYDVRASRFWRTYSKRLSVGEGLKIKRVKKEMEYAAKKGEVYHLWFHPHNLATNIERNITVLKEIARHFVLLNEKYGMISCSMNECKHEIQGGY